MIQDHHPACRYVTSWHQGAGHMWFQTIDRIDCHPDCDAQARLFDPVANAKAALRHWTHRRRDYSHARGDTARMSLDER